MSTTKPSCSSARCTAARVSLSSDTASSWADHTLRHHRLRNGPARLTVPFHDLRHSTATLLLEQGVELVVIKELLGHAHIGVTATVYAHVRLRLQRQAIDTLGTVLGSPENTETARSDGDEPPPCAARVR
ncbi:tyrosine-type recombinase/integrase [Streptomyces parvulus]